MRPNAELGEALHRQERRTDSAKPEEIITFYGAQVTAGVYGRFAGCRNRPTQSWAAQRSCGQVGVNACSLKDTDQVAKYNRGALWLCLLQNPSWSKSPHGLPGSRRRTMQIKNQQATSNLSKRADTSRNLIRILGFQIRSMRKMTPSVTRKITTGIQTTTSKKLN